jgi:hypothetical protein
VYSGTVRYALVQEAMGAAGAPGVAAELDALAGEQAV